MKPTLQIEEDNLRKATITFRAINNKLRVGILQLIHKHGAIKVQDIHHKLKIEQSVASQHLSVLRSANLVLSQRDGRCIYYSVNYDGVNKQHIIAMKLLGIQEKVSSP
jgi:DNA-binding transcriptional ArsR family regulator